MIDNLFKKRLSNVAFYFVIIFSAAFCASAVLSKDEEPHFTKYQTEFFNITASDEIMKFIKPSLADVLDKCSNDIGVMKYRSKNSKIPFFVSTEKEILNRLILDNYLGKITLSRNGLVANSTCSAGSNGGLFVVGETINFCVIDQSYWNNSIQQGKFCSHFSHEIVHIVQNELSRAGTIPANQSSLDRLGPAWLFEGFAVFLSQLAAVGEKNIEFVERQIRQKIPTGSRSLMEMESYEKRQEYNQLHYLKGFVAAKFLYQRSGEAAFFLFYACLGNGENWPNCFNSNFGMSVSDFYEIRSLK